MIYTAAIIVSLVVLYGAMELRKGLSRVADEIAGLKQAIAMREKV